MTVYETISLMIGFGMFIATMTLVFVTMLSQENKKK